MKCPYCNFSESKVIDSRPAEEGEKIRRRRQCLSCGKRFTTYEIVETTPLLVIKKDGTLEQYDRSKLMRGILRSCEKRPVTPEIVEQMVNKIESRLSLDFDKEVTSTQIGGLVMEYLQEVDDVSYIRFASVYQDFQDIEAFIQEMNKLLKNRKKS